MMDVFHGKLNRGSYMQRELDPGWTCFSGNLNKDLCVHWELELEYIYFVGVETKENTQLLQ